MRGRLLKAPPGGKVRPTQERVREALFSMLAPFLPGARFVDLYAGSGVVGLEAYSRGAGQVTWVEGDRRNAALLHENLKRLGLAAAQDRGELEVVHASVEQWLRWRARSQQAEIVFADPPYAEGAEVALGALMAELEVRGLAPGGIFVAEMEVEAALEQTGGWELLRERVYGGTRLVLMRRGTENFYESDSRLSGDL